jgi:hypothetical protein
LIAVSSSTAGSSMPTAAYMRRSVLRWSMATTANVPSGEAIASRDVGVVEVEVIPGFLLGWG